MLHETLSVCEDAMMDAGDDVFSVTTAAASGVNKAFPPRTPADWGATLRETPVGCIVCTYSSADLVRCDTMRRRALASCI